jgi:hypothetical protein
VGFELRALCLLGKHLPLEPCSLSKFLNSVLNFFA